MFACKLITSGLSLSFFKLLIKDVGPQIFILAAVLVCGQVDYLINVQTGILSSNHNIMLLQLIQEMNFVIEWDKNCANLSIL